MFKTWLTIVVLLFILAELWLWVQKIILPFPIYVIAGAILALVSNLRPAIPPQD